MIRLIVRTRPAHGDARRYRAGLGPFGREPLEVEAAPAQAEALRADPALLVAEADGAADAPAPAAKPAPPTAAARTRRKNGAEASNG